mmetsp:Transcript_30638/g.47278  ORF Transcript_30638/g.47278 Transcript_30638/m.47278 type:complete len:236 (-) Transcript_30638:256-963(-)
MVPPLPYLARMQMFIAWYEPLPIWLSSNEAPAKRMPIAFSLSSNPPLPNALHSPHMLSLTPSVVHVVDGAWHQPVGHAPAAYAPPPPPAPNSHCTLPSTRSVSASPAHELPFENLFQSNPLLSSSALLQHAASLLFPCLQFPYQCTCFAAPDRLLPPQFAVGGSVIVPPLPYLARMQMFIAWYEPVPIWLSSNEAPLKRKPIAFSRSSNPPFPNALHSPHMLSFTPRPLQTESNG